MHVEEIRATKFGLGINAVKNPLAKDMHESIRHLAAELYQKDLHFVMELIQVEPIIHLSILCRQQCTRACLALFRLLFLCYSIAFSRLLCSHV